MLMDLILYNALSRGRRCNVTKSVLVAHSAGEMFALVDDVEAYPSSRRCGGAKVLERHENGKTARIDIDYHGVKAHFTTANENQPPDRS